MLRLKEKQRFMEDSAHKEWAYWFDTNYQCVSRSFLKTPLESNYLALGVAQLIDLRYLLTQSGA